MVGSHLRKMLGHQSTCKGPSTPTHSSPAPAPPSTPTPTRPSPSPLVTDFSEPSAPPLPAEPSAPPLLAEPSGPPLPAEQAPPSPRPVPGSPTQQELLYQVHVKSVTGLLMTSIGGCFLPSTNPRHGRRLDVLISSEYLIHPEPQL